MPPVNFQNAVKFGTIEVAVEKFVEGLPKDRFGVAVDLKMTLNMNATGLRLHRRSRNATSCRRASDTQRSSHH